MMSRSFLRRLPFALLLCAVPALGSCRALRGASQGPAAAPAEDAAEDDAERASSLEIGRLELELARLENRHELQAAELEVEFARAGLEKARRELSSFLEVERGLEVDESVLGLDGAKGRTDDAAAELAELEAMYKEEEFAKKTKELVITRSRRNLDLATRSLDLARRRKALQDDRELPAKQSELEHGVRTAEKGLAEAEQALERKRLSGKITLAKAERDFAKLEKEAEKAKAARKAKGSS